MDEHGIEYKYVKVTDAYQQKNSLKEINDLLGQGWRPVREIHLSGTYNSSGLLVLLKRTIKKADVTVTEVTDGESDTEDNGEDGEESPQPQGSSRLHCEEYPLQDFHNLP